MEEAPSIYYSPFTIYGFLYYLRKNFDHLLNGPRQHVDFFSRVVKSKRRARSRGNIKTLHYRLGAMMAGAYSNAFLIKDGADVMWMNIVNDKRQHTGFLPGGTDDAYSLNRFEPLGSITQQFVLVRRCFISIYRIQVINGGAETDLRSDRRSSRFKFIWQI